MHVARMAILHALATTTVMPRWAPVAMMIAYSALHDPSDFDVFLLSMLVGFYLRCVMVVSVWIHETSHVLAACLLGCNFSAQENLLFHVPLRSWLLCLSPVNSWPEDAKEPHVQIQAGACKHRKLLIELAGFLTSALLAGAATFSYRKEEVLSLLNVVGTSIVAAGAVTSDLLHVGTKGWNSFHCGNFGMLIIEAAQKSVVDFSRTLRAMAGATAARGGQAGGLVTVLRNGTGHRTRYVPSKRADLASGLLFRFRIGFVVNAISSFFSSLLHALCCCFFLCRNRIMRSSQYKKPACRMYLGHTRFATSSAPRLNESHPHRFSGPQTVRVWRVGAQGWEATDENFEVYVTHNGDFDYWELFESLRTQKDLGRWLQNVLEMHKTIASCDSVKVAGMMELLRTQGIWKHSIRLAYQTSVQPSFQTTMNGEMLLEGSMLNQVTAVAEKIFEQQVAGASSSSVLQDSRQVKEFTAKLAKAWYDIGGELRDRCGTCELLAQHAVCCFLENDIFTALDKFLSCAHGSFGITACCTLDPNVVAIASRGQAMSVSFNEDLGAVLWGSEASAQMVPIGLVSGGGGGGGGDIESQRARAQAQAVPKCTHRHDLDEDGGEVIEIAVCTNTEDRMAQEATWTASGRMQTQFGEASPNFGRFSPFSMQSQLFLRVHRQRGKGFMTKEQFIAPDALLSLVGVGADGPALRKDASQARDKVAADLADIPPILTFLRKEFSENDGKNRVTARHFFKMLRQKVLDQQNRRADESNRLMIDVLVTGAEASLWLGEQFASDLQSLFPTLRVIPMSSNKIIGVLSNTRGEAPMSGFAFCSTTMSLKDTIVVSISHSGQTFPTLHATHALRKVCGDRVFVLTGSVDSKMSAAVGQHAYVGAPWTGRVWTTYAGWRPSEALTVSTVAAHHVLTELLLYLAEHVVCDEDVQFIKATGNRFRKEDVKDLYRLNRDCCVKAIPNILGRDLDGKKAETNTHKTLTQKGRFWALHVLEGPYSWCLSAAYIFGTVVSGYPIFTGIMRGITHDEEPSWLRYLLLAFDSLLYSFLPLFFSMILRLLQGREQFARLGKRTLVIGDVPYVHQLLESYVSKLFSLSYSIASIDVHGANAVDHLVHRFTHRVTRGVLLAVGRPDGRLFSQTKAESWVMMAMQQAKAIVHLLSPPEIITVGHNPFRNTMLGNGNITLETLRPSFLCESLAGVDENEPMSRMATIKELNKNLLSAQTSYADHFDEENFAKGENLEPIGSSYLQVAS